MARVTAFGQTFVLRLIKNRLIYYDFSTVYFCIRKALTMRRYLRGVSTMGDVIWGICSEPPKTGVNGLFQVITPKSKMRILGAK